MAQYQTPAGTITYTLDPRFVCYLLKGENRVQVVYGTYGYRRSSGSVHRGIDVDTTGSDWTVRATVSGKVTASTIITDRSNPTWEWGHYVVILDAQGYKHYYCHLASRAVKVGDTVTAGQVLGVMGMTGNAAQDTQKEHVHYEVRKSPYTSGYQIDPTPWCGIPNKQGQTVVEESEVEVMKMSTSPVAMRLGPMTGSDYAGVKALLDSLRIGYGEAPGGYLDTVEISGSDQNTVLQKVSVLGVGYVPLCTVTGADSEAMARLTEELEAERAAAQAAETARAAVAAALETARVDLDTLGADLGKAEKALHEIAKAVST